MEEHSTYYYLFSLLSPGPACCCCVLLANHAYTVYWLGQHALTHLPRRGGGAGDYVALMTARWVGFERQIVVSSNGLIKFIHLF